MLPTDLLLASLCLSSENDALGFDFIDDGIKSGTGVWWAVKYLDGYDVIVFRGSLIKDNKGVLLPDWLRDFDSRMIHVDGLGMVHAGFYKNIPDVMKLIAPHLRGCPVVVTGHSLGAARACLYSASLTLFPARVVIFGCPNPGTQELAEIFVGKNIISYKNGHDPVTDAPVYLWPEFPYVSVCDFTHVDGMVDTSLGWPWDYHHELNYLKGIQNDQPSTSQ